jgi:hypothetical protein
MKNKDKEPAEELAQFVRATGRIVETMFMVALFIVLSVAATIVAWNSVQWVVDHQQKWAVGVTAVLLSAAWFAFIDRRK